MAVSAAERWSRNRDLQTVATFFRRPADSNAGTEYDAESNLSAIRLDNRLGKVNGQILKIKLRVYARMCIAFF
jgi:hypothetical protein